MAKLNAIAKTRVATLMNEIGIDAAHKSAVVDFCSETKGEHDDEAFRLMAVDQSWFPSDKKDEYLADTPPKAGEAKVKRAVSSEQVGRVKAKAKPKAETTGEPAPKAETVETEGGSEPNEPVTEGGATRSDNLPNIADRVSDDELFKPVTDNVEVTKQALYTVGQSMLKHEREMTGSLRARIAVLGATLIYFRTVEGIDHHDGEMLEVIRDKTSYDLDAMRRVLEHEMFRIDQIADIEERNEMVGRMKSSTVSRNLTTGAKAAILVMGAIRPHEDGHLRTPGLGIYWFKNARTPAVDDAIGEADPSTYYQAIGAQWCAFEPEIEAKGGKTMLNEDKRIYQMNEAQIHAQFAKYILGKKLTIKGTIMKGTPAKKAGSAVSNAKVVHEMTPGEIVNAGLPKVAAELFADDFKANEPQLYLILQAAHNAMFGETGKLLANIVTKVEKNEATDDERAVHTVLCMLRDEINELVGEAEVDEDDIEKAKAAFAKAA